MTRDELYQAVQSYAHRSIDPADFSTFLKLAEAKIINDLRAYISSDVKVFDIDDRDAGGAYILPPDFNEIIWARDGTRNYTIKALSRAEYDCTLQYTGGPVGYVIKADSLNLAPIPPEDYRFIVGYWAKPGALVDGADTNPVLTAHPQVYLDSVLVELYRWSREAAARDEAEQRYQMEVGSINVTDERRRMGSAIGQGFSQDCPAFTGSNGGM